MTISEFKKVMDMVKMNGSITEVDIYSCLSMGNMGSEKEYKRNALKTLDCYLIKLTTGEYILKDGTDSTTD